MYIIKSTIEREEHNNRIIELNSNSNSIELIIIINLIIKIML